MHCTTQKLMRITLSILIVPLFFGSGVGPTNANSKIVEFPVDGNPFNIVAESPGRVWYTLPDDHAIGLLVVTDMTSSETKMFKTPTENSEPYDLAYDQNRGIIWFTEKSGNRLGKLEIETEEIVEFELPTANSQPTGIAVAPNGLVWIAESSANKLASFDPATNNFTEYLYTPFNTEGNAELHDVVVLSNNSIWLTATADSEVVEYVPSLNQFLRSFFHTTGGQERPLHLAKTATNDIWVTDPATNVVGFYSAGTVTNWFRFVIADSNAASTGIIYYPFGIDSILLTSNAGGVIGSIPIGSRSDTQPSKISLPTKNSAPWGISVDPEGVVWVAENGNKAIARWEGFSQVFLPLVQRS